MLLSTALAVLHADSTSSRLCYLDDAAVALLVTRRFCDQIVTGVPRNTSKQMQLNSLVIICRRLQLVADVVRSEFLQFAAMSNNRIHNPKVSGSSPLAATIIIHLSYV
jgi:hypothetical protein